MKKIDSIPKLIKALDAENNKLTAVRGRLRDIMDNAETMLEEIDGAKENLTICIEHLSETR